MWFQDGRFSVLQTGGAAGWCVNPVTGDAIQMATLSPAGQLSCTHTHTHTPLATCHSPVCELEHCVVRSGSSWCELQGSQCRPDGSFLPLQCDVTSCWCVSEDGQEVQGTRTSRQTGRTPSCDRRCLRAQRHLVVTRLLIGCFLSSRSSLSRLSRHPWCTGVPASG